MTDNIRVISVLTTLSRITFSEDIVCVSKLYWMSLTLYLSIQTVALVPRLVLTDG